MLRSKPATSRALRAAEEQAERVKRARDRLARLEQEKAERAKRHAKDEAVKNPPIAAQRGAAGLQPAAAGAGGRKGGDQA